MKYLQLTQIYRDDVLAEAMYGREVEHFHYDFDRINFEKLLTNIPAGNYRTDIENRLKGSIEQMTNVERIYAALKSQIVDLTRHDAAILRTTAKREKHVLIK